MAEKELKEILQKELKRFWFITIIVVAVITAGSNLLASKLFYENDLKTLKERIETDEQIIGRLGFYIMKIAGKVDYDIPENPLMPNQP
jgi:hypothetical protein